MNAQFERTVTFQPAFDKRHPDPNKNYGVGAMRIRFVLEGPKGAMQFVVSGGMYLPHVEEGEKAVWAMLEERYHDRFGEEAR